MPQFNWDYWRSLQGGPAAAPVEVLEAPQPRDVPGQITQGLTPGVWATLGVPRQGSGPEQAIAEYQARAAQPRNDVWGQTLTEDRPENLARELFIPFQRGLQTGMNAFKPRAEKPEQFIKSGSTILRRDPINGGLTVAYEGDKNPGEGVESQRRLLEDRIKAKRRAIIREKDRDVWGPMIDSVLADEAELEKLLSSLGAAVPGTTAQRWQVDPSNISVGAPKSFMIPPMPGSSPTQLQSPRQGVRIRSIRQRQ